MKSFGPESILLTKIVLEQVDADRRVVDKSIVRLTTFYKKISHVNTPNNYFARVYTTRTFTCIFFLTRVLHRERKIRDVASRAVPVRL
jgi:hypothetical protein